LLAANSPWYWLLLAQTHRLRNDTALMIGACYYPRANPSTLSDIRPSPLTAGPKKEKAMSRGEMPPFIVLPCEPCTYSINGRPQAHFDMVTKALALIKHLLTEFAKSTLAKPIGLIIAHKIQKKLCLQLVRSFPAGTAAPAPDVTFGNTDRDRWLAFLFASLLVKRLSQKLVVFAKW
jgi:hypothetical protein